MAIYGQLSPGAVVTWAVVPHPAIPFPPFPSLPYPALHSQNTLPYHAKYGLIHFTLN